MSASPEVATPEHESRGVAFWIGLVAGLGIMAYGVSGVIANASAIHPVQAAKWLIGADLIHDIIVAPVFCFIGWLAVGHTPPPWRSPLRGALVGTAAVLAIGFIPLRGYGRIGDNPSLEPLRYSTAVLTAVGIVWVACAAWAAVAFTLAHRQPRGARVRSSPADRP